MDSRIELRLGFRAVYLQGYCSPAQCHDVQVIGRERGLAPASQAGRCRPASTMAVSFPPQDALICTLRFELMLENLLLSF